MKVQSFGNPCRGVSTLEILIAFAVLILSITAVIIVVFGNQTIAIDTQTNIEAISKAQALLEQERALARQDFTAVQSTGQTQDDIYKKKVTVSYPNPGDTDTKLVVSQVSWSNGLRSLVVNFSTLLTNGLSSSFCNPSLPSPQDWKDPTVYKYETTELVALATGNNSNGLGVSGIDVFRNRLYLAVNTTPSSDPQNNSLYIFNLASNPATIPTFLGYAKTTGDTLAGVAVAQSGSDQYAYVVSSKSFNFSSGSCNNTTCPQFQVIKVTTPAIATKVAGLMIPATAIAGSNQYVGRSIFYDKGYVYVGLTTKVGGTDSEFNIIDVGGGSASPTNPVRVGNYHVGFTVNSISVKGNYAYLATTDNAASNKQLLILDISDKTNPHLVSTPVGGFFSAAGVGVGYATQVVGSKVYLGRAFSGTSPNFYILNATNPASYPTGIPQIGPGLIAGTDDSVRALTVRDYLAFLVTNKQFQVWNIANPSGIYPWTTDGTTGSFLSLMDIDAKISGASASSCSGDQLYLGLQTSLGNDKDIFAIIGPHVSNSYALSNNGDISVVQGNTGTVTVTAAITSGYPGSKTFTVSSGLPSGVTASFSPSSCMPGCVTTLTFATSASTPVGAGTITVAGTGGVTTTFTLNVTAAPFDYTLSNSGNITTTQGSSGVTTITSTLTSGASQAVTLTASGLPSGATATFGNNNCTVTCSGSLTIVTTGATPVGTYPITVTGTNGKTTMFNLIVNPVSFDYAISAPASVSVIRGTPQTFVVTLTRLSGTAVPVTITLGNLPTNVDASPASLNCTPATTCTVAFTLNATTAAPKTSVGVVTGNSPNHTRTFNASSN